MEKDVLLIGTEERLPLYQEVCEEGEISFRVAHNLHTTLEAIREKLPRLIIVDYDSLEKESIEICQTLKKYPGTQRIPLIFVVPRNKEEDLLEALFIPVNDYVFLPLDGEDFKYRVKIQLKLLEYKDKKKLISIEEKIEELEKLLQLFPDYNAARQELTEIYEKVGRIEDALECLLKLAKEYYNQNNFGLAMDVITKMKTILAKHNVQLGNNYAQFVETLDRCLNILSSK